MKCLILFTLLTISVKGYSQMSAKDSVARDSLKKFISESIIPRISIRQSFQGKADKEEAGYFNIVNPTGKPNSYNYSFAIGYSLFPSTMNLTPFLEWQKNTLSEKEQNVFLAGFETQTPILPKDLENPTSFLIAKINYKNDKVKNTESIQASIYYTISVNGKAGHFYPLPDVDNNFGWLSFFYNPYVGYEYENRYQAKSDSLKGNSNRFYCRITANIYPLSRFLDRRLEIIPDFTYRRGFSSSTEAEMNENKIFKIDFNIILVKTKIAKKDVSLKFGLNYTKGVDPTKGFDDQEVMTYAFKIKI